jgi:hypothetical protein
MSLMERVEATIRRLRETLLQCQGTDCRWSFCFESGVMTDAYMILLMKLLKVRDERLTQGLVERILARQDKDGVWRVFEDEMEGNLSATVDASVALMYAGVWKKGNPVVKRVRKYVRHRGGIRHAGSLTKVVLSLLDIFPGINIPRCRRNLCCYLCGFLSIYLILSDSPACMWCPYWWRRIVSMRPIFRNGPICPGGRGRSRMSCRISCRIRR